MLSLRLKGIEADIEAMQKEAGRDQEDKEAEESESSRRWKRRRSADLQ